MQNKFYYITSDNKKSAINLYALNFIDWQDKKIKFIFNSMEKVIEYNNSEDAEKDFGNIRKYLDSKD